MKLPELERAVRLNKQLMAIETTLDSLHSSVAKYNSKDSFNMTQQSNSGTCFATVKLSSDTYFRALDAEIKKAQSTKDRILQEIELL